MTNIFKKSIFQGLFLLFLGISLMFFKSIKEEDSQRVPFIGQTENCHTSGDNGCTVTICTSTQFILWIPVSSEISSYSVDCDNP